MMACIVIQCVTFLFIWLLLPARSLQQTKNGYINPRQLHLYRNLGARGGDNGYNWPDVESESDFIVYCEHWFMETFKGASMAFVSQDDLVDFLAGTCMVFDEEDIPEFDCPAPTFASIAIEVQLVFVKHLCNVENGEEMLDCLKSIVDGESEFGLDVDIKKSPFVEELCCGLLPFISLVHLEKNSGKLRLEGLHSSTSSFDRF